MTAAFLVPCLVTLRAEFNELAPGRGKGADGWIGDTAHAARASDHNPDAQGRVLALDIDSTGPWPRPFDDLVEGRRGDDRLEYVIWNRRIASRDQGWTWRTYTGTSDPHTGHAHFSARHDHSGNDSTAPWEMTGDEMLVKKGDSGDQVRFWQYLLGDLGFPAGAVDGDYGPKMEAAVNASRQAHGQGPNPAITGWHAFILQRDLAVKYAGKDGAPGAPGKDGAATLPSTLTVTGGRLEVTA